MNKQTLKDTFGWGMGLWFFGYVLGFLFYAFVPSWIIGWVIMPFGILATMWVLFKKIKNNSLKYYLKLAVVWTLIAIIFDYFFLVKLLRPVDGYYKLDVYLYYLLTFALPIKIGWWKNRKG